CEAARLREGGTIKRRIGRERACVIGQAGCVAQEIRRRRVDQASDGGHHRQRDRGWRASAKGGEREGMNFVESYRSWRRDDERAAHRSLRLGRPDQGLGGIIEEKTTLPCRPRTDRPIAPSVNCPKEALHVPSPRGSVEERKAQDDESQALVRLRLDLPLCPPLRLCVVRWRGRFLLSGTALQGRDGAGENQQRPMPPAGVGEAPRGFDVCPPRRGSIAFTSD